MGWEGGKGTGHRDFGSEVWGGGLKEDMREDMALGEDVGLDEDVGLGEDVGLDEDVGLGWERT